MPPTELQDVVKKVFKSAHEAHIKETFQMSGVSLYQVITVPLMSAHKDTYGETKFIEICKYGDIYECIDDNDVENFVNSMINEDEMRGFFGGCAEYNDLVDND